jgi:3-hydroxyacyl-CoA dehydrogenase
LRWPLGPFQLSDLVGLDVVEAILDEGFRQTGDQRWEPVELLRKSSRRGGSARRLAEVSSAIRRGEGLHGHIASTQSALNAPAHIASTRRRPPPAALPSTTTSALTTTIAMRMPTQYTATLP